MEKLSDFVRDIINRQSSNYDVKIIADSYYDGNRITTIQITCPRFIWAEIMTHKRFSRNAASSRARPVSYIIDQVLNNPAVPIYWGKNKSGMQAKEEVSPVIAEYSKDIWLYARNSAVENAKYLSEDLEVHKQVANRILEPFMLMEAVITATDWEEFFALRIHDDAQPEIIKLAYMMREALFASTPKNTKVHLPYISSEDMEVLLASDYTIESIMKISSARCARVSYKLFDGSSSFEKDIELAKQLYEGETPHASPAEHPAIFYEKDKYFANMKGWKNFRTRLAI